MRCRLRAVAVAERVAAERDAERERCGLGVAGANSINERHDLRVDDAVTIAVADSFFDVIAIGVFVANADNINERHCLGVNDSRDDSVDECRGFSLGVACAHTID